MQEKDIIEKHLENYEDVFIDVINVRVAFLGIENQSQVDKYMPMRVIGYDGAVYRGQLLEIRGHIRLDMPVVFEKLLD